MSKTKRTIVSCTLAFSGVLIILLCIINAIHNKSFWDISIYNGVMMLWTVAISFFLTQSLSRQQKHADVIRKIIVELIENINESKTCNISVAEETRQILLMQNRQIGQQISLLKRCAQSFGFEDMIGFIEAKYDEYEKIISDHINDLDYLSKSKNELSRPIKLINDKLYEILMKI